MAAESRLNAMTSAATLARAHGAYNVISGVWPLVHMRSFEAVTGPKDDHWLVRTVAGLLIVNGGVQLASADSLEGQRAARLIGLGTSGTLTAIEVVYGSRRRIRAIYLVDAALEIGIIAAWLHSRPAARLSQEPNAT